jgi:hypothetical protein
LRGHTAISSRAAQICETLRSLAAISPPPKLARSQRATHHIRHEPVRGPFPPTHLCALAARELLPKKAFPPPCGPTQRRAHRRHRVRIATHLYPLCVAVAPAHPFARLKSIPLEKVAAGGLELALRVLFSTIFHSTAQGNCPQRGKQWNAVEVKPLQTAANLRTLFLCVLIMFAAFPRPLKT